MMPRCVRTRASRRRFRVHARRLQRALMGATNRDTSGPVGPGLRSGPRLVVARRVALRVVDRPGALDRIADALIRAHAHTADDGDSETRILIEAALLHVGRRIARREAPFEGSWH